jgi:hypothetical protein
MIGKLFFPTLTQESIEPRWGRGWSKSTMPAYLDANIRFCIVRSKYMTEHFCYLILILRSVENVHDFRFKMHNFSHIDPCRQEGTHTSTPSPLTHPSSVSVFMNIVLWLKSWHLAEKPVFPHKLAEVVYVQITPRN